ncbi:MAG: hypothetical protein M3340_03365 [Actinomycetota bacterium]|nr:hypothetical protein [Actinomycetota bacterium]
MPGQEESDQLPEEGPGGQTPDDDGDSGARDEAEDQAGAADEDADDQEDQGTGNPANAG